MNLQAPLKTQWFEMTKAGIKTEDYREITPYWYKRFVKRGFTRTEKDVNGKIIDFKVIEVYEFKKFSTNTMTLGYPKSTDSERILKLEHKGIEIRTGKEEWGAEPNKLYFVIKHGEIINE